MQFWGDFCLDVSTKLAVFKQVSYILLCTSTERQDLSIQLLYSLASLLYYVFPDKSRSKYFIWGSKFSLKYHLKNLALGYGIILPLLIHLALLAEIVHTE